MRADNRGEKERGIKDSSPQPLSRASLEELESILDHIIERYHIDYKTLSRIILGKEQDILIPAAIFKGRTRSITEIAFSYLKHSQNLAPESICGILNIPLRKSRALWNSSIQIECAIEPPYIPAHVLGGSLTPFESLVEYLREQKRMKNADIARLLERSNKTVWTVYARAKGKKLGRRLQ